MRNNIYCTVVTPPIKELAAKLGKNISVVNNLVSTWQTENKTTDIPTVEQAKERLQQSKNEIDEFYLAVPYAEVRDFNPNYVPIEHVGNTIYLTKLPSDKPMEYFFNLFSNLPELKELIATPREAYQFMLWREMAFIEEGIDRKTKEAGVNADNRALDKARQYRKNNPIGKPSVALEETIDSLRDWYRTSREHIRFDESSHTYYIDGKPADFSVTEYIESVYGKPNIVGDYSHSSAIGTSIDRLSRDFFSGVDVIRTQYPNISESRKSIVLGHLNRLRNYLDSRFGRGEYKVITTEFPIAAQINALSGSKIIAGTMDMIVVDNSGNIHIFDFKVKNHPINQTYNGVQVTDSRDYTAQQNMYKEILETANPALKGKVKSLQLVWFDTAYPKLKDAQYNTDANGNVTVSDKDVKDQPLSVYPKFSTPSLRPNITESIIPLPITNKVLGLQIPQMNTMELKALNNKPLVNSTVKSFTLEEFEVKVPDGRDLSGGTIGISEGKYVTFYTIEGALQAAKLNYLDNASYTPAEYEELVKKGRDSKTVLKRLSEAKTTMEVLDIVKETQIDDGLNVEEWNKAYPIIRKALESKYAVPSEDMSNSQAQQSSMGPVKQEFQMTFSYGNYKRANVASDTIFDAIRNGERTATTRYTSQGHISEWNKLQVGDIIRFRGKDGRKLLVRITKPLVKLSQDTNPEEWSLKEGWSTQYFNKNVKPKLNEAYQIEYEYVGDVNSQSSSRPTKAFGNELLGGQSEQEAFTPREVKVPEVGSERLHVNTESESAKLARTFTPMERVMRVEMLARTFSRKVDEAIQSLTEELKEQLSQEDNISEQQRLQDKLSRVTDSEMGRRNAIEEYGINRIFDEMKQEFEGVLSMTEGEAKEDYGEDAGPRLLEASRKILDNFYPLLNEACALIEGWEDIRIIIERQDYHDDKDTTEVISANIEDSSETAEVKEANLNDDENGNRTNGSEGWSYKVRFTDPHTTISKKVKRLLSDIALEGVNGLEYDDLGNLRYLNAQTAYATLMDKLSSMIDASDFSIKNEDGSYTFPALEQMRGKYPWVGQVINTLQTDPTLISSFFTAFRKDFIPYWMQYFDEAAQQWRTYAMNAPVALDSTITDVTKNYEQGITLDSDSIYSIGGFVNRENAAIGAELAKELVIYAQDFGESDYGDISERLSKSLRMIGFNVTPQDVAAMLETEDGHTDLNKIVNAIRSIFNDIANGTFKEDEHLITEYKEEYKTIASIIGQVSDLSNVSSVRQGDKTLYSYSAPNHINTLVKQLKSDRFESFLNDQFGKYEWFKTGDRWRSGWLRELASNKETRNQLELKELKYLGNKEYEEWTTHDIRIHFLMEYYSVPKNRSTAKQYAWYNFPIFSDSPVAMMIKFTKESGEGYKSRLIANMRDVILQELYRIKLVEDRRPKIARGEVSAIANYDNNGDKFHFFPEFNSMEVNGMKLLDYLKSIKDSGNLDALYNAIDDTLVQVMDGLFDKFVNNLSETDIADVERFLTVEGIISGKEEVIDAIEEYYWNQVYASSQIIELTTADLAFYKNGIDFQKRFKEVYAAGDKLNTNSEYGREFERTIYLEDQIVTSSSFIDVKDSLDAAVAAGRIKNFDRDNILNKFKDINVTDAQAMRSPSSFRAVLDMLGKWDDRMQKAMDNFHSGEWDMEDFNVVWQTIKPFVYSQIPKADGFGGNIKVPHQNKNSEFLLLSMYQTIAGPIKRSPKLKALGDFMEKHNIDVIQFQSAVKSGGQGIININYSSRKLRNWINSNPEIQKSVERAAYNQVLKDNNGDKSKANEKWDSMSEFDKFKLGNDLLLEEGKITQEVYNSRFKAVEPNYDEVIKILEEHTTKKDSESGQIVENQEVIHTIPYSDYIVQQSTPEHLFDVMAVFGSQFRNLIIADLPEDFTITIGGKTLNKQETVHLYQAAIVENLLSDYTKLKGKFATIETFQQEVLRQIKGSAKYSRDMVDAMDIVTITHPITGRPTKVFNVPMNNPSTTSKLQELVMSMFKNSITKQYINGGACIMVSDFGLTDELKVTYNKEGDKSSGIKGIECYLPAYSKKFYEALMVTKVGKKADGSTYEYLELDINLLPEDLKRAVGYRIPTEDKYSMVPLIIKGFLPQQNGSSIMLPADITTLAGSDFDVDKMFLMLPAFKVIKYDMKAAKRAFEKVDNSAMKSLEIMFQSILESQMTEEEKLELLASEDNDFRKFFNENKERFRLERPKIVKERYDVNKVLADSSYLEGLTKEARNNMIIDIAYRILSHPDTAEKINNPGSFDKLKVAAKISNIISDPALKRAFIKEFSITGAKVGSEESEASIRRAIVNRLLEMSRHGSLKQLDKFVQKYMPERNSLTPDTFTYNHRQNMTGAALIGMYANNTTMQAKYQFTNIGIADRFSFIINGVKVHSLHDATSELGERISKLCANFSAASVDNVKDPVLASLMQNTKTANIAATLIRAGVGIEEVGLLFSQPIIRSTIEYDGSLAKLDKAISTYIDLLRGLKSEAPDKKIARTLNYTSESLLENCIMGLDYPNLSLQEQKDFLISQINIGRLFTQAIIPISEDLAELTRISRADSPNGAIAPSIAGAKLQTNRVKRFLDRKGTREFTLTGLEGVLDTQVNPNMSKSELREQFFKSKMPMLQAFYSLGIDFGTTLTSEFFPQANEYTDMLVNKILNNAPISLFRGNNGIRVLNAFYDEAIRFGLSKTTLFGDEYNEDGSLKISFNDKRDYYLYDYPAKFLEAVSSNKEVSNISAIKKLEVVSGEIVMRRSGRLTSASREMIMNAFDQLLYMDGTVIVTEDGKKVEKPIQQLAVDLFMYSFYKEGLKFGPNSFGYFMSTQFLTSFPEFINALREMHYDMRSGTYFDRYLDQFYANHFMECVPSIPITNREGKPTATVMPNGNLSIASAVVMNPNGRITLDNGTVLKGSYERIIYDGKLYMITNETQGNLNYVEYSPMPTFDVIQDGLRYDANRTVLEMKDVTTDENRKRKNKNINSRGSIDNAPQSLINTISEGFSLPEGFEESFDNSFMSGIEALEEQYTVEEGQNQLEVPMCK